MNASMVIDYHPVARRAEPDFPVRLVEPLRH
jgi:hypothetical protein